MHFIMESQVCMQFVVFEGLVACKDAVDPYALYVF